MENWIADAVGKMHVHGIKQSDIAKAYGCSREFINRVLNGKVQPPAGAKEKIIASINDLIASKS